MFAPLLTRTQNHDLPKTGLLIAGFGLAAALTACGGGGEGQVNRAAVDEAVKEALASQAAAAPDDAPTAQQPSPTAAVVQAAPTPSSDQVAFAMPSLIGANLQVAQDQVQTLGILFSVSHDLLGARSQFVDSNWRVCTQTPPIGTMVKGSAADYEGKFDFGAVKLTEACP